MIRDKNLFGSNSHGAYKPLPHGDYDDDEEKGGPSSNSKYGDLSFARKIKDQDDNLDELGNAVSRLGTLSLNISNEIKSQNSLLSDLEQKIDGATESAEGLVQKTKDYLKNNGNSKTWTIVVVLMVVLIILIILVVET